MGARERWNERYAGGELEAFPDAPVESLFAHHDLLTGGGRALDVACGDGRNALYLAQLGYMVDAIDVSDVVIGALREAVQQRGLAMTIAPRVVDLERGPLPAGPYDVVVMLNYLQRDLFGALAEALAPGGLALCERSPRAMSISSAIASIRSTCLRPASRCEPSHSSRSSITTRAS